MWTASSQQAHNVKTTSYQRRCDVITSHDHVASTLIRRHFDVVCLLDYYPGLPDNTFFFLISLCLEMFHWLPVTNRGNTWSLLHKHRNAKHVCIHHILATVILGYTTSLLVWIEHSEPPPSGGSGNCAAVPVGRTYKHGSNSENFVILPANVDLCQANSW